MDAGRLRHRVIIERQSHSQDATTGEVTTSWVEVASVWAAIEPLSAREFIQSQAVQSKVTARIVIRYRSGIDSSMRINHNGRYYNIHGVLPDKDSGRDYITMPVSEGTGDGL